MTPLLITHLNYSVDHTITSCFWAKDKKEKRGFFCHILQGWKLRPENASHTQKQLKSFAPGEARTHGLQIMRLTRCLLRYRGGWHYRQGKRRVFSQDLPFGHFSYFISSVSDTYLEPYFLWQNTSEKRDLFGLVKCSSSRLGSTS